MEKVRPWCGQPSDRGRLRNRTEYPYRCTDGGETWHTNFTPIGAVCRPWGEKPQNRPLSKLNNPRFVLCAMLPVNKIDF